MNVNALKFLYNSNVLFERKFDPNPGGDSWDFNKNLEHSNDSLRHICLLAC